MKHFVTPLQRIKLSEVFGNELFRQYFHMSLPDSSTFLLVVLLFIMYFFNAILFLLKALRLFRRMN